MIISLGQTPLDVPGVLGWTPRVTRLNDGTAVAVSPRMLVAAGHFDARGATDWSGVTATARKVHPRLDLAKVRLDADAPGFHAIGARPANDDRLVLSGTGVTATYGSSAPAAFDYATRARREGFARANYYSAFTGSVAALFEDPADGSSYQPSATCAIHDSGSGCFNDDGDLLGIVVSTFYIGATLGWTGYPGYTDTSDLNPIGGTTVILLDAAREWIAAGYDATAIACVEVLYTESGEVQTPVGIRVCTGEAGSWMSTTGLVVANVNGVAYRTVGAPTTEADGARALFSIEAGGTLPAAGCCDVMADAFTRSSDLATTSAAANLRYISTQTFGSGGGGTTLGTPLLRGDGANSENDLLIFLRNNATDFANSSYFFDRAVQAVEPAFPNLVFRGIFSEGWGMIATTSVGVGDEARTDSNGSVNSNIIVSAGAEHVGTPADRGVVNISNLDGAGFVVDGGDGTSPNKQYTNLRASFFAPAISIASNAGSTSAAISRNQNQIRYAEVTAPVTGTMDVTPTGTVVSTGGSTYAVRVSHLNSVAPLDHIAESTTEPLLGTPVTAGERYMIAVRNTTAASRTVAFDVAFTEAPEPEPESTGFLSAGRRRMPGGASRRRCFI